MTSNQDQDLDMLMQQASQALADMRYNACENLCHNALIQARGRCDWDSYIRILRPLQETRRQRRQAAEDAGVHVLCIENDNVLELPEEGGLLLVGPEVSTAHIESLHQAAQLADCAIVILRCHESREIEGVSQLYVTTEQGQCGIWVEAPGEWRAHWFVACSEALGDQLLAEIELSCQGGHLDKLAALEQALAHIDDHEKLHQSLAACAALVASATA